MKRIYRSLLACVILLSCNSANTKTGETDTATAIQEKPEQPAFFPVTDFLKGQLQEIKGKGINPIKFTLVKGKEDSVWLKTAEFENEVADFLSPVIDSSNLVSLFTEKKFLDQTINAFTLTYDPKKQLPDSFGFKRWDVYVDPQKNIVTRIFLVKKTASDKTLQLTWVPEKQCRIVTIAADAKGNDAVEKEVTIKWDF
jgi:hypothetical protein